MHYSHGLEYIVKGSYTHSYHSISYFSKNVGDNCGLRETLAIPRDYAAKPLYKKSEPYYLPAYADGHFSPEIFLNPSRPKTRFISDIDDIKNITNETFELMMNERIPKSISLNILPFEEFKSLHSRFGAWSNGILGFSINKKNKKIFIREDNLDVLMIVIGHEIGHVLTETLPNKHDEEAKAFAFSIEWAKTIKENNIANLGLSIKDEEYFEPAKNGLHDVAFQFVSLMLKKGRKAIELHEDLARKYVSVFNKLYF